MEGRTGGDDGASDGLEVAVRPGMRPYWRDLMRTPFNDVEFEATMDRWPELFGIDIGNRAKIFLTSRYFWNHLLEAV